MSFISSLLLYPPLLLINDRAWGFVLCSDESIAPPPQPESVDRLLAAKTTGGYGFIDGITLLGILQTPLYIRTCDRSRNNGLYL